MIRAIRVTAFAVLLLFALPMPVQAHALIAKARVQGDTVNVHAEYDDRTIARKAKVIVKDANDTQIEQGETDGQGNWSFPKPKPGHYTIRVDAGAGHLKTIELKIDDPGARTEQTKPVVIADAEDAGPSRWLKLGIGVGIIVVLGLAALAATRLRGSKNAPRADSH